VPYRGGGPALADVIGGQVPLFFANLASSLAHIQAGRLRPLAVTSKKRSAALPEVPTMDEAGVPGYEVHDVHVFDGAPAARPGHYAPPLRSLPMLAGTAAGSGVERFVLVQPSVYGTDNRLLLDALATSAGRHRGVVVIDGALDAPALRRMHTLGVRGVRCNLVSPVGNPAADLALLAPQLRELGWHVQWYAQPSNLAGIAALHAQHRLTCVLDHLAGFGLPATANPAEWAALRRIADAGGWLKLSGWYRLGCNAPYLEIDATLQRAAALFEERCVWGSDWPHTHFLEPGRVQPSPGYDETWQPVFRALGAERAARVLRMNPQRLYE
jgi:predicted TIM-barrel fold metal-dependent hydrolase